MEEKRRLKSLEKLDPYIMVGKYRLGDVMDVIKKGSDEEAGKLIEYIQAEKLNTLKKRGISRNKSLLIALLFIILVIGIPSGAYYYY